MSSRRPVLRRLLGGRSVVRGVAGHRRRRRLRHGPVVAGAVDPERDEDVRRLRIGGVRARHPGLLGRRLLRARLRGKGFRPVGALRARRPRQPERKDDERRHDTAPHAKINVSHLDHFFSNCFQIC